MVRNGLMPKRTCTKMAAPGQGPAGPARIKGALERRIFGFQLVEIAGDQEREFIAAEELEALLDGAELRAVAVLEVEAGNTVGATVGKSASVGSRRCSREDSEARSLSVRCGRRHLPVPAGQRQGEARIGNPAWMIGEPSWRPPPSPAGRRERRAVALRNCVRVPAGTGRRAGRRR